MDLDDLRQRRRARRLRRLTLERPWGTASLITGAGALVGLFLAARSCAPQTVPARSRVVIRITEDTIRVNGETVVTFLDGGKWLSGEEGGKPGGGAANENRDGGGTAAAWDRGDLGGGTGDGGTRGRQRAGEGAASDAASVGAGDGGARARSAESSGPGGGTSGGGTEARVDESGGHGGAGSDGATVRTVESGAHAPASAGPAPRSSGQRGPGANRGAVSGVEQLVAAHVARVTAGRDAPVVIRADRAIDFALVQRVARAVELAGLGYPILERAISPRAGRRGE